MKTSLLSTILMFVSFPLSANAPLALRVEIMPTSITAEGTLTTVEVQLAPPDRGRIGRQARMRVKLMQGTKTLAHILQDVDFNSEGLARTEYTWAPGRYELSLEVESLKGSATGLWIGQITIPENLDQRPEPPTPIVQSRAPAPVVAPPVPPTAATTGAAAVVVAEENPTETPALPPDTAPAATEGPVANEPITGEVVPPPDTAPASEIPGSSSPTGASDSNDVQPEVDRPPHEAPDPSPSGPLFGLVLNIDPTDFAMVDRAAGVKAELENMAVGVTLTVIRSDSANPSETIDRALDTLRTIADARAVVVITDGRGKASRSDWKRTAASAVEDDVPIFTVGLWNDDFDPGTRKQLSRLATDTGGRSYLLQPSESLSRALAILESVLTEDQ